MTMKMDRYTRGLASFASSLEFQQLPRDVVEHAKLCLLDILGVGLFGSTLPWSRIVADCVVEMDGTGPSTLWGSTAKLTPTGAALVNGTAVHGFELDDNHKLALVHPGPVVVAPALAMAEYVGGVTGERFLAALVAGYEVLARVGLSLGSPHMLRGYHPTATHGTLGAAAASGSLLGLTVDQMHHALGIAGTQAAGLMAAQFSSMVKRFHAGRAAQSGVYASLLAKRGYTGITNLFESEYGGYCSTLSSRSDKEKLIEGLGEVWETRKIGFKLYSTNGACHPIIDAVLDLKQRHGLVPDDVESIRLFTSSATKEHVGWPYVPDSVTTAQMNASYIVAVAITDGEAFVDQFTEERIRDPRLVELAGRVEVTADPDIDARGEKARVAMRMVVKLKNGQVLEQSRESGKGSADHPIERRDVENKFRKLAEKALPRGRVEELRDLVDGADALPDVGVLGKALATSSG